MRPHRTLKHRLVGWTQPWRKRDTAQWSVDGRRAELSFGGKDYFIEIDRDPDENGAYDFLAWMVLCLAMRRGIRARLDAPISYGAARALTRVAALWAARMPAISHPLDLDLPNLVPDPPRPNGGGLLCLSSGADSTYAGLRARRRGVSHALMIHGADFSINMQTAFDDRHALVENMAAEFGLDLITVRTDLFRSLRPSHGYFTLVLMACLTFAGRGRSVAEFSADQTAANMLMMFGNGNMYGIEDYMKTPALDVSLVGTTESRAEKLRAIHEHAPQLLPEMRFCHDNPSDGSNCGQCEKCMRTRLALEMEGFPQTLVFSDEADPIRFYESYEFRDEYLARVTLFRLEEAIDALTDADAKARLADRCRRIRLDYFGVKSPYPTGA